MQCDCVRNVSRFRFIAFFRNQYESGCVHVRCHFKMALKKRRRHTHRYNNRRFHPTATHNGNWCEIHFSSLYRFPRWGCPTRYFIRGRPMERNTERRMRSQIYIGQCNLSGIISFFIVIILYLSEHTNLIADQINSV